MVLKCRSNKFSQTPRLADDRLNYIQLSATEYLMFITLADLAAALVYIGPHFVTSFSFFPDLNLISKIRADFKISRRDT